MRLPVLWRRGVGSRGDNVIMKSIVMNKSVGAFRCFSPFSDPLSPHVPGCTKRAVDPVGR